MPMWDPLDNAAAKLEDAKLKLEHSGHVAGDLADAVRDLADAVGHLHGWCVGFMEEDRDGAA